jgi:hypothetical protein
MLSAQKQKGPNSTDPTKRTKNVRGCEYQVVPGLAQITSMKVVRSAENSVLKQDEYEVYFKFEPMEGDEVIEQIKDTEIEFVLRSGNLRVPVGPEYIKEFRLKEGTRYAMNLLQTRNREACTELYTYESKALRNDLFEPESKEGDVLYWYKKDAMAKELENSEKEYKERKEKEAEESLNQVDPIETPTEETPVEEIATSEYTNVEDMPDYSTMSEEELRALVEKEVREQRENGEGSSTTTTVEGIDEAKLREEAERKIREEMKEQFEAVEEGTTTVTATEEKPSSASDAIKEAKRRAKELEKQKREEERQQRLLEEQREKDKAALRAKIEEETRRKLEEELAARKEAARKEAAATERAKQEELNRKRKALEKKEAIKRELMERIVNEEKRKECTFSERIAGTIEVIKVSKVKDAGQSHLGHSEFEVMVTFRPNNYAELMKKDKKQWEAPFVFTLDPKSQNANPGSGYIRKYKVSKSSRYEGFAEMKSTGICNDIIVYSPDLPNDVSKIKLK